jgi:hypothetical protein
LIVLEGFGVEYHLEEFLLHCWQGWVAVLYEAYELGLLDGFLHLFLLLLGLDLLLVQEIIVGATVLGEKCELAHH